MSNVVGTSGTTNEGATNTCLICGDRANAHSHYGAISCTSCRAFFRRAITTKAEFQCIFGTDKCEITKSTRKRCQACRLRTCLKVGMNPGWIMGERRRLNNTTTTTTTQSSSLMQMTNGNHMMPHHHQDHTSSLLHKQLLDTTTRNGQPTQLKQPSVFLDMDSRIAPGLNALVSNGELHLNLEFEKTESDAVGGLLSLAAGAGDNRNGNCSSSTGSKSPSNSYSSTVVTYSALVGRAIKFARGFQEFWNLSENDQRTLLLHNCDPIIQLCTNRGFVPPWCQEIVSYAHQHRDLQNEITMLHGDSKTKLLIAFMALFSSRFCALENKEQVDRTRDYSQTLLQKYLTEMHGLPSGTELFSKWCRILHCLQLQSEEAMAQQLHLSGAGSSAQSSTGQNGQIAQGSTTEA